MALTLDQQKKIAELQKKYNETKDPKVKESLHQQANAIRDAAGVSHLYDRNTGAYIGDKSNTQNKQTSTSTASTTQNKQTTSNLPKWTGTAQDVAKNTTTNPYLGVSESGGMVLNPYGYGNYIYTDPSGRKSIVPASMGEQMLLNAKKQGLDVGDRLVKIDENNVYADANGNRAIRVGDNLYTYLSGTQGYYIPKSRTEFKNKAGQTITANGKYFDGLNYGDLKGSSLTIGGKTISINSPEDMKNAYYSLNEYLEQKKNMSPTGQFNLQNYLSTTGLNKSASPLQTPLYIMNQTSTPTGNYAYKTTITLPDGSTETGYIKNGITYREDGTRPPAGSFVETAGGIYVMHPDGYGIPIENVNLLDFIKNEPVKETKEIPKRGETVKTEEFVYNAPQIDYKEYQKQAKDRLNPYYDTLLKQTLEDVNKNAISRGFFGQLPWAEMSNEVAAKVSSEKASNIEQLAQELYNAALEKQARDRAQAFQEYLSKKQLENEDRNYNYRVSRDEVEDSRWNKQFMFDYQKYLQALQDAQAQREAEKQQQAWERGGFNSQFDLWKAQQDYQNQLAIGLAGYKDSLKEVGGTTSKGTTSKGTTSKRNTSNSNQTDIPKTLSERKMLATSTLLDAANKRYENLKKAGYKYPLYYTINSILNDPKWQKAAIESGADVQSVINALIRSKSKLSPDDYFMTKTGSKLSGSYEGLH